MGRLFLKKSVLIFKLNIRNSIIFISENKCSDIDCKKLSYDDSAIISSFYLRNNYNIYSNETEVKDEFNKGSYFYAVLLKGEVIAGMWIHRGQVDIKAPSFESLKYNSSQTIVFNDDTIYSSHNLVDLNHRGKHLYSTLLKYTLLDNKNTANNYVYITGLDNEKMIKSGLKYNGQIIGITYVIRIFKYFWIRKKCYFGEIYWKVRPRKV